MVDFILKIDLLEIFYAAIGAFLGFFLAFITEKRLDRFRRMQSIKNIVDELAGINQALEDNILSKISEDLYERLKNNSKIDSLSSADREIMQNIYKMANTIYFPIWTSVVNNGDLLDFRKEEYFDELIQVYTRIIRLSKSIDGLTIADSSDLKKNCNIVKQCIQIREHLHCNCKGKLGKLLYKERNNKGR